MSAEDLKKRPPKVPHLCQSHLQSINPFKAAQYDKWICIFYVDPRLESNLTKRIRSVEVRNIKEYIKSKAIAVSYGVIGVFFIIHRLATTVEGKLYLEAAFVWADSRQSGRPPRHDLNHMIQVC